MRPAGTLVLAGLVCAPLAAQPRFEQTSGYVGSRACARCHSSISERQLRSNMKNTWRSAVSAPFSADYSRRKMEGPAPAIDYLVSSHQEGLKYKVSMAGRTAFEFRLDSIIGGPRFGVGFLFSLKELAGIELVRDARVETRYRHDSQANELGLTAGHPPAKPSSFETAFGRVLTSEFEERCLGCHGDPKLMPNAEPGVSCEVCHGPGERHVQAAESGENALSIKNPGNWLPEQSMNFCGQCHSSDHNTLFDPRPQDLLISNQAYSLKLTECYVQSGGAFSCLSCHDPHQNAKKNDSVYVDTCRSCHGGGIRAVVCPVEPDDGCIECHMPSQRQGRMVDHWIRVVAGKGSRGSVAGRPKSRVSPRRVFLRLLAVNDRSQAQELSRQLGEGASFHDLAKKHSIDPFQRFGGYLGPLQVSDLARELGAAAKKLAPGQLSPPIESAGRFVLLQRMPRDFRRHAIAQEMRAASLLQERRFKDAFQAYRQALRIDPHFLRAMKGLGEMMRKGKRYDGAIALLERAAHLYPKDADTAYQLGLAHGLSGSSLKELRLQGRAVALNPELIGPRMRLGVLEYQSGRFDKAAFHFQEALRINPLLSAAHLNLGNTLERQGRSEEAEKHLRAAAVIGSGSRE